MKAWRSSGVRVLGKNYSSSCFLWVLVGLFVFLYGFILYAGSGRPYVFDNNESYSTYWHAYSLHKYGVNESMGLADEVFSPHRDAHPFVHTHQGNFPRLFGWLIFELGATTPESQIVVTTLTVGLATIMLMFGALRRISSSGYAFLACIVLMTDYILFAQWVVVTYRVWYGFLLFLNIYTIERILIKDDGRWYLLIFLSCAALLYFELIYAAFVGLFSFFWVIYRLRGYRRRVFLTSAAMLTGALGGLMLFFSQGINYLGWNDFLRDVQITFTARNNAEDAFLTLTEIREFYAKHNVIFWINLQDGSAFRGVLSVIRSITNADWMIHTPLFSLLTLIPGVGLLMRPNGWLKVQEKYSLQHGGEAGGGGLLLLIKYFFLVVFLILAFHGFSYVFGVDLVKLPRAQLVIIVLIAVFLAWGFAAAYHKRMNLRSIALVVFISIIAVFWKFFFDQQYSPLWTYLYSIFNNLWASGLALCSLLMAHFLMSFRCPEKSEGMSATREVSFLLLMALIAYCAVYLVGAGYVFSGYVSRQAPFTVFFTDMFVALVFFEICKFAQASLLTCLKINSNLRDYLILGFSSAFLFSIGVLWFILQLNYFRILPPTHFSFLEQLRFEPYRGASFVANHYAAPIAAYTGEWAYMDASIGNALFSSDGTIPKRLMGDDSYLWFADKNINAKYRRPDYFLCMLPQTISSANAYAMKSLGGGSDHRMYSCENLPLVKLASSKEGHELGLRLVEMDDQGYKKFGYASWAIVKFDWSKLDAGIVWPRDLATK